MRCLSFLSCLAAAALSQQWVVTIDDGLNASSTISSLALDRDGNAYVTGTVEQTTQTALSAKVSSTGEVGWTAPFNPCPGFWQQGNGVVVDDSGCVYAAMGSKDSCNVWRLAVVKYRPDGIEAWRAFYADTSHYLDYPRDIALDPRGGCFVTGETGHNSWNSDFLTVSYDPQGTRRWARNYDGPAHRLDGAGAVTADYQGNCYVTGSAKDSTRTAVVTIKYDTLGNSVWTNKLAEPSFDICGNDILVNQAGIVYVTGSSTPVVPELLTMKLNAGGDTLWKRRLMYGVGVAVRVDAFGNVYAVGTDASYATSPDIVLVKYNAAGVLVWNRTYDGPAHGDDWAYDLALGPDSSVYVCGRSQSRPYWDDFFVIKYGYRGDTLWEARLSGNSMYGNGAYAMEVDRDGNVIVAGSLGDTVNGTDFVVAKFPPSGPGVTENSTPGAPQQMLNVFPTVVSRLCRLTVPAGEHLANLSIADITGRTVRGISVPAGRAGDRVSVTWDTRDEHGQLVPNGVYFVRLAQALAQAQAVCKVIVQRQ